MHEETMALHIWKVLFVLAVAAQPINLYHGCFAAPLTAHATTSMPLPMVHGQCPPLIVCSPGMRALMLPDANCPFRLCLLPVGQTNISLSTCPAAPSNCSSATIAVSWTDPTGCPRVNCTAKCPAIATCLPTEQQVTWTDSTSGCLTGRCEVYLTLPSIQINTSTSRSSFMATSSDTTTNANSFTTSTIPAKVSAILQETTGNTFATSAMTTGYMTTVTNAPSTQTTTTATTRTTVLPEATSLTTTSSKDGTIVTTSQPNGSSPTLAKITTAIPAVLTSSESTVVLSTTTQTTMASSISETSTTLTSPAVTTPSQDTTPIPATATTTSLVSRIMETTTGAENSTEIKPTFSVITSLTSPATSKETESPTASTTQVISDATLRTTYAASSATTAASESFSFFTTPNETTKTGTDWSTGTANQTTVAVTSTTKS